MDGDWYCPNCGYLSGSRVTYSETCDTCHSPVEWHDLEKQDAVEKLQVEIDRLSRSYVEICYKEQEERRKRHEVGMLAKSRIKELECGLRILINACENGYNDVALDTAKKFLNGV